MNRLICFELKKLLKSRLFYVCLLIFVLFAIIMAVINCVMTYALLRMGGFGPYFTDVIGEIPSNLLSSFTILFIIYITLYINEDYRFETIKTIKAKGFNNKEIYFSKYIVSLIACIIFFVCGFLICTLIDIIVIPFNYNFDNSIFIKNLILPFLELIAIHSVFYFLSSIIHKASAGILIGLMVQILVPIFLSLISLILNFIYNTSYELNRYFVSSLSVFINNSTKDTIVFIVSCLLYLVIFNTGTYLLALRKNTN